MGIAKASCVSQILTAEAIADDVGMDRSLAIGVQSWAKCHKSNSERDVHRVIKKQKSKLDIPVKSITCNGVDVPWISPESWLHFVVQKGLWPVMSGCNLHDYEGARRNWSAFWATYEKINPTFQLFTLPNVDYSRTAAWLVHGDEGRTLKKGGLMVTALQSTLGKGYDEKRVRPPGNGSNLRVNFAGHTFTTRMVVSTIPKTAYESNPELFHSAMDHTARSMSNLFRKGYVDQTRGGEIFKVVLLGVKGDAPYLQKVSRSYRAYNTAAKRGEERGPPKGVCGWCLAGTRQFPCEELATDRPKWVTTIGVKLPWVTTPSFIQHCLHDRSDPSTFFNADIWHVVHLGFGRSWIASVIQLTLPYLPCSNLDEKWDYLTAKYHGWCKANKKQSHISKITAYLMSYNDSGGAMGNWHKGALTANFFQWIVEFLGEVPQDPSGFLVRCRQSTYRMNAMFGVLYRSGAFLTQDECSYIAQQGLEFLSCYAGMALEQYRINKQWMFPLYPKLHTFHHIMLETKWNGLRVGTSCNPMIFSCQMDEDTVGRTSRLSRRVNIRRVAARSLDRYLVAAKAAYVKAKLLT